jgi:hypothetical protein
VVAASLESQPRRIYRSYRKGMERVYANLELAPHKFVVRTAKSF